MSTAEPSLRVASARPEMTAAIMAETGLDEHVLHDLVHEFCDKVRRDLVPGPILAARIIDWGPHLDRMVAFWSSVALMTGRYHGRPVAAHTPLAISTGHFDRWLALFRETAHEVCTRAGASHVIERAERIAHSLHMAVREAQVAPDAVPALGCPEELRDSRRRPPYRNALSCPAPAAVAAARQIGRDDRGSA